MKTIAILSLSLFLFSCGNNESDDQTEVMMDTTEVSIDSTTSAQNDTSSVDTLDVSSQVEDTIVSDTTRSI